MEVTFNDPGLRLICEDDDVTTETYSESIAHTTQNRIAGFQAALSLNDIIIGQLTQLDDDTFRINLINNFVIHFSAVNRNITRNAQGKMNKRFVNRIKLLSIESHIITQ